MCGRIHERLKRAGKSQYTLKKSAKALMRKRAPGAAPAHSSPSLALSSASSLIRKPAASIRLLGKALSVEGGRMASSARCRSGAGGGGGQGEIVSVGGHACLLQHDNVLLATGGGVFTGVAGAHVGTEKTARGGGAWGRPDEEKRGQGGKVGGGGERGVGVRGLGKCKPLSMDAVGEIWAQTSDDELYMVG
jgi:hypothetical protein